MSPETIAETVSRIIERQGNQRGGLISLLEEIQDHCSYLPQEALEMVAEKTGRSLVDVYGVATFYRAFSLKPRGKHLISVCLGTACHVRGGPAIAEEVQKHLGVKSGETTPDNEFTLETVNCLGACALGPVVVVDGHYFPKVKTSQVKDILDRARAGADRVSVETDPRIFPIDVSCAHCNHTLMDDSRTIDGRSSIRVMASIGPLHGWMALSSMYGSYHTESEFEIPPEAIVQLSCPFCHAELTGGAKCGDCGAPMVPMIVKGGGVVQFCSRRACKGHILDLGGTTFD